MNVNADQRWDRGRARWVHPAGPRFCPDRYTVEPVDPSAARPFVTTHHYSASWPSVTIPVGLFEDSELVGVCTFGQPSSLAVLELPFPGLDPRTQARELNRLVLLDRVPFNAESWFVRRALNLARDSGIRGVVSFSDPQPRYGPEGEVILPGHIGTVYQALGARYTGLSSPATEKHLPDGTMLHARTLQKIRAGERGDEGAVERLVALGASRPSGDRRVWLRSALLEVGARNVRNRGKHRYLFPLGATPVLAPLPYPKVRAPEQLVLLR